MKDLSEIMVNSDQLKMIIGFGISDVLHYKLLGKAKYLETDKLQNQRYSLKAIIDKKHFPLTRPIYKEYNKKDPIKLAIGNMAEKGLSADIRDRIFNSKICISKGKISGQFYFLKQFLTSEQVNEINGHLINVGKITQTELF